MEKYISKCLLWFPGPGMIEDPKTLGPLLWLRSPVLDLRSGVPRRVLPGVRVWKRELFFLIFLLCKQDSMQGGTAEPGVRRHFFRHVERASPCLMRLLYTLHPEASPTLAARDGRCAPSPASCGVFHSRSSRLRNAPALWGKRTGWTRRPNRPVHMPQPAQPAPLHKEGLCMRRLAKRLSLQPFPPQGPHLDLRNPDPGWCDGFRSRT